ncbi:MAG TPA: PQQ-dependent sugar dehydrogenase [Clostridia bacterium]|nr:PQQ-dependent sugar dehydrogenase [Clostridia bacterium]
MKYRLYLAFFISVLFTTLLLPVYVSAQVSSEGDRINSTQTSFQLERVVGGLEHPWAMDFLPNGDILISERPGRMLRLSGGELMNVVGLPDIYSTGQGGLLDIAVHPDFQDNKFIYFTYSASGVGGAGTVLYRARLEGDRLRDGEQLYQLPRFTRTNVHFGSRLVFAPDGTLYMSIGERGERQRAQQLTDAAGSTLRLNPDGSIPGDNPFVNRDNALPEIYSYGHRNAQGMAVHPDTGRIWQHEHGPRGGDEVNIIKAGANYGWPRVSFGEEYRGGSIGTGSDAPGIEAPLIHWTPSIAPSGMSFYTGNLFQEWQGDLFVGALAGQHLRRLELEGKRVVDQEVLLQGRIGRIRDVKVGPEGYLWLLTDEQNGSLYRLKP